ncbi:MAG: ATPase domain-containing protein, partial [Thermoguttaceae bacterium]
LDPVTNLVQAGTHSEAHAMLMRMIDYLKSLGTTTWMTSLTEGGAVEQTEVGISSLTDTWILLRNIESSGERNRGLYLIKSRGMAHSNQIREYRLTDHGFEVMDVYLGPAGSLTGSARLAQETKERGEETLRELEFQRQQAQMEAERKAVEAQIAALQARLTVAERELQLAATQEELRRAQTETDRAAMAQSRQANPEPGHAGS